MDLPRAFWCKMTSKHEMSVVHALDWNRIEYVSNLVQKELDAEEKEEWRPSSLAESEGLPVYRTVWEMWKGELADKNANENTKNQSKAARSMASPTSAGASTSSSPSLSSLSPSASSSAAEILSLSPKNQQKPLQWYHKAHDYWNAEENCSADVNGVLGGFGDLSDVDARDSLAFLTHLRTQLPDWGAKRVLDCGAGIGRVAKFVLSPTFDVVDLLEQSPRLLNAAPAYMGEAAQQLGELYCEGMQSFTPRPNSYDCCWFQWVLPHLTDVDLIDFLMKCKKSLKPNGVICIKENVIERLPFEVDFQDSSVARCDAYFRVLFRLAGLQIVYEKTQEDFPEDLFKVKLYALQ